MGALGTGLVVISVAVGTICVLAVTLGKNLNLFTGFPRHVTRGFSPIPFNDLAANPSATLANYLGNVALFVPLFVMVAVWWLRPRPGRPAPGRGRVIAAATATGALLSGAIEVAQYVFGLGITDADDLLGNTAGALLGALLGTLAARWPRAAAIVGFTLCLLFYLPFTALFII